MDRSLRVQKGGDGVFMGQRFQQMCAFGTHSLGMLSVHSVAKLQQGLELIVPGERDDL